MLYVSLPEYTVGLLTNGRAIIKEAPPVARWTIGRHGNDVVQYFLKRGARVIWISRSGSYTECHL